MGVYILSGQNHYCSVLDSVEFSMYHRCYILLCLTAHHQNEIITFVHRLQTDDLSMLVIIINRLDLNNLGI